MTDNRIEFSLTMDLATLPIEVQKQVEMIVPPTRRGDSYVYHMSGEALMELVEGLNNKADKMQLEQEQLEKEERKRKLERKLKRLKNEEAIHLEAIKASVDGKDDNAYLGSCFGDYALAVANIGLKPKSRTFYLNHLPEGTTLRKSQNQVRYAEMKKSEK